MTRSEKNMRKQNLKLMRNRCAELGITVPKNATEMHLEMAIFKYYRDAAVVRTEDGLELRQTDKPTNEYTICFTVYIARSLRAESEEDAIEWIKGEIHDCYHPDIGDVEDCGFDELIDVYEHDDEVQ